MNKIEEKNKSSKNFLQNLFSFFYKIYQIFFSKNSIKSQSSTEFNELKTSQIQDPHQPNPNQLELQKFTNSKIDNDEELLDEDNEENFIIKDGKKIRKKHQKIKQEPRVIEIIEDLIKNKSQDYQTNQQRNLDRETGGTELPKTYTTSSLDVWDDRTEEIQEMAEIKSQDYNSDDKASMIWEKKRKKKQQKDLENNATNHNDDLNHQSQKTIFSSSSSKGKSRHL
jgi:hypothetical protein